MGSTRAVRGNRRDILANWHHRGNLGHRLPAADLDQDESEHKGNRQKNQYSISEVAFHFFRSALVCPVLCPVASWTHTRTQSSDHTFPMSGWPVHPVDLSRK